jgi:hypothetical protein
MKKEDISKIKIDPTKLVELPKPTNIVIPKAPPVYPKKEEES